MEEILHHLGCIEKPCLGGSFKDFLISPLPGEMIKFDEPIFQMGWNHQPVVSNGMGHTEGP